MALIHDDWCPEKRKTGHRHTERRPGEGTERRPLFASRAHSPQKKTNPADPLLSDFQPPEMQEDEFRLLTPPSLWHLLQQVSTVWMKDGEEENNLRQTWVVD